MDFKDKKITHFTKSEREEYSEEDREGSIQLFFFVIICYIRMRPTENQEAYITEFLDDIVGNNRILNNILRKLISSFTLLEEKFLQRCLDKESRHKVIRHWCANYFDKNGMM